MWTNQNTRCTFLQDAVVGFKLIWFTGSNQFAQLKSNHIARESLPSDSQQCQSGTMSQPSPSEQKSAQKCSDSSRNALTIWSLREAFRAKTLVLRESRKASWAGGRGCGANMHVLFARFDPDSCSWKIPASLFGLGLDEFSETWPSLGMMRHGECWVPTRSVLDTYAREYGLLQNLENDGGGGRDSRQFAQETTGRGM